MTIITMTFDNGPDPDATPLVLDTLRRHGLRSTFFVLGDKLRDRRALSERAHAEGHWIGNHTFNHLVPFGTCLEPDMASREIALTQDLVGDLSHERRFFRPFGGGGLLDDRLLNREAVHDLESGAYTCVLWNVVPGDWIYPDGWVGHALDLCFSLEHALLVLHDLPTGAMTNLDRFINQAAERGATFQQDFPPDCVPIERGRQVRSLEAYVAGAAQGST